MSLMLHTGAEPVQYTDLKHFDVPEATATHVPIPHTDVVDMVKYALGYYGHDVTEEHYGITEDGARFFGLLSLRSTYGDYTDTVGLRNSHDKRFPIGISIGSRVFVCDNLAFIGDHVIKRKHTANAKRDLPGLVAQVIEPLREQRERQQITFRRYQETELQERHIDATLMQLYRQGVINVTRIEHVLNAYEEPPHDWGGETAYRLFNATTFALKGRVSEDPRGTAKLHQVIDGVCTRLN